MPGGIDREEVQRLVREERANQCTCSSPSGLAFSSPMAAATSPERVVVSYQ